jgi:uncharacterized delta-60 repeat protein
MTLLRVVPCVAISLVSITSALAQTWENLSSQIPGTPYSSGPYPSTSGTWFAGTSTGDYRSTDGGVTWTNSSNGLLDPWNRIISGLAYYKTSSGRILRGGSSASWDNRTGSPVWYSDNDGLTWTEAPYPSTPATPAGISFTSFIEKDGIVFAADHLSQGVWKSTDDGVTWVPSRHGLPITSSFGITITAHSSLAASGSSLFTTAPLGGIFRSRDNGENWVKVGGSISAAREIVVMDDGTLIAVVNDNSLYRSRDDGDSWQLITGSLNQGNFRLITTDGTRLFTFTQSGVLLESSDGGDSFAVINGGTQPTFVGGTQRQLSLRGNTVLLTATGGFYRLDTTTAPRVAIAPVITTQPTSLGVNIGRSFTLSVAHSHATLPITYQWKLDGDDIDGATGPTYTVSSATLNDAGSYTVVVSNAGGNPVSSAATVTVGDIGPGLIDYGMQPYSIGGGSLRNVYGIYAGLDGSTYAAGQFNITANATPGNRIMRFKPDGTLDLSFAPDAAVFGANQEGFAVFALPDGSVLVGGGSRSGTSQHVWRKVGPDGKNDPSFNWPNDIVGPTDCVIEGPEGTVYVSGAYGVYRIFTTTGEIDFTFNPPTFSSSPRLRKVIRDSQGRLYIIGNFSTVNGRTLGRIARLDANGVLDPTFTTSNSGFNQELMDIALQNDQPVVVGGFTSYRGTSIARVARLNLDGTLDTDFAPPVFNGNINAITVDGANAIIVGGAFTTVGGNTHNNIVRFLPGTSTRDPNFPGNSSSVEVTSLLTRPEGSILVGSTGRFHRLFGAEPVMPRISFVTNDAKASIGQPVKLEVGLSGPSTGATYQWFKDGELLAGENSQELFRAAVSEGDTGVYHVVVTIDSAEIVSPLRRIDALGAPRFIRNPQTGRAYLGTRHLLSAKAVGVEPLSYQWLKNGAPLSGAVSAGHFFTSITANDAGTWSLRVTNPQGTTESDPFYLAVPPRPGTVDPTFTVTGYNGTTSNGAENLIQLSNGQYIAIGSFPITINSQIITRTVVRLFEDGTIDPTFDLTGQIPLGSARWLFKQADGKILVGTTNKPFRLTTNLEIDPTFTPPAWNSWDTVESMLLLSSGQILIQLSAAYSPYTNGFIRLNSNGALDGTFTAFAATSTTGQPRISAMTEDSEGRVLIAGNFATFGGQPRNRIARLLSNGSLDSTFTGPGTFGTQQSGVPTISVIAVSPEGEIFIGGDFGDIGGLPARGLAKLDGDTGAHDPTFYPTGVPTVEFFPFAIDFLSERRLVIGSGRAKASNGGSVAFDIRWPNGALDTCALPTEVSVQRPKSGALVRSNPGTHLLAAQVQTSDPVRYGAARLFTGDADLAFVSMQESITANLGTATTLSVVAAGTSNISYQWKKDGQNIAGANGATLNLGSITRQQEGSYTVDISNDSGSLESPPAYVDVLAEPEITSDPVSVVIGQGSEVTLTVAVKGRPTLTYAWTRDGATVTNQTGKVTGATTSSLKLTGVTQAEAGAYRAIVTNNLGSTSSRIADVEVRYGIGSVDGSWTDPVPFINSATTANPVRLLPTGDGGFFLGGTITGFQGYTTHRWAGRYNATGSRITTFAPTSTTPLSSGYIRWALHPSNILYATSAPTSGGATTLYRFTETGGYVGAGTLPATINDIFFDGDGRLVVASAVSSSGKRVLRYTVDTTANTLAEDTTFVTAINNHVYGVYPSPKTGGYYITGGFNQVNGQPRAMMARIDENGSLDTSFTLNTSGLSGFSYMDRPFVLEEPGGKVYFRNLRLNADGSRDTTWNESLYAIDAARRGVIAPDGKILIATNRTVIRLLETGEVDTTFGSQIFNGNVDDLVLTASGQLYIGGDITGSAATFNRTDLLRLNYENPDIGFQTTPGNQTVDIGQSATFTATTYGEDIVYKWYHNGQLVSNGGRYSGATSASLTITNIDEADAGSMRVAISNTGGLFSATAYLTVNPPPSNTFATWPGLENAPADKRGPLDMPDGDGIPNLIKFALGLDIGVPAGSATQPSTVSEGGTVYPSIVFQRRTGIEGVSIQVIASSTIPVIDDIETEVYSVTDNGDGTETVVVRTSVPVSALPRQFLSVKVSEL